MLLQQQQPGDFTPQIDARKQKNVVNVQSMAILVIWIFIAGSAFCDECYKSSQHSIQLHVLKDSEYWNQNTLSTQIEDWNYRKQFKLKKMMQIIENISH